ncbi:MAG TPA: glycosyltransferase family 4 protein [Candidatus Limnocylindria bacterium]|nr:glycosyltransferase family 4 protein [Candidatus Limnocylindria bacterium]
MTNRRYRVLLVCSHPVPYSAPILKRMAQDPRLDIQVAYCSLQGVQQEYDPEFGIALSWDTPMLVGHPWVSLPNRSWRPGTNRFWGLVNPGLWRLIQKGKFDAVSVYTGYMCASYWIAVFAAKLAGTPLVFSTDAHELRARDGRAWKGWVKTKFWPRLFRVPDVILASSTGGVQLMRSLGLPQERIEMTRNVVDNQWWVEQAARSDRVSVRAKWNLPLAAPVVLFCAKLQPWKRPLDLLEAFSCAGVPGAFLVFAGDGPQRVEIEERARDLGVADRVKILGFVNQSQLPETYRASDLFVLPSDYEPFGLVVNEAMLCGCPVVVSDKVGAQQDLVAHGKTGFVFAARDVQALSEILRNALRDLPRLEPIRVAARAQMDHWSPEENVNSFVAALEKALARHAVSQ